MVQYTHRRTRRRKGHTVPKTYAILKKSDPLFASLSLLMEAEMKDDTRRHLTGLHVVETGKKNIFRLFCTDGHRLHFTDVNVKDLPDGLKPGKYGIEKSASVFVLTLEDEPAFLNAERVIPEYFQDLKSRPRISFLDTVKKGDGYRLPSVLFHLTKIGAAVNTTFLSPFIFLPFFLYKPEEKMNKDGQLDAPILFSVDRASFSPSPVFLLIMPFAVDARTWEAEKKSAEEVKA